MDGLLDLRGRQITLTDDAGRPWTGLVGREDCGLHKSEAGYLLRRQPLESLAT